MDDLGALIRRDVYLHSLLPLDVGEFTDDNLIDKLNTMELVMAEIMANTRAMQSMLGVKGDG
ncbi:MULTISPECIES: hypothetical protein [unclassified Bradyrhizobium]|uniref:hypothetical protein n=1 Tax=unclassified Bradyrhizobium TaxID=2631580 RepID=UPI001FF8F8D5|nr:MULTISPECIES: hypothetical protein [unclassified Bradyrhizobium]MCK1669253.1 hypothetical protein [Bradyrhizobium sp. 153]MCK1755851.1 hypothetical protein [Bradyrhizobium sp. 137]